MITLYQCYLLTKRLSEQKVSKTFFVVAFSILFPWSFCLCSNFFLLIIFFANSYIIFSWLSLAWAQSRSSQTAQQLCRNNPKGGSLFPHEDYCDYYYECDSATGDAVLQACPNGLAFAGSKRGLIQNCDYPHRVGCPDGTRVIGRK